MEGAQLDVIGAAAVPGTTTMFLHHGTWAAEIYWESQDRWCLAKTFKLSITDAKSETSFGLRYDLVDTKSDCVDPGDPGGLLVFSVTASRQVDGRTTYDGSYTSPFPGPLPATRTVCSAQWDVADPCGYTLTGVGPITPTE